MTSENLKHMDTLVRLRVLFRAMRDSAQRNADLATTDTYRGHALYRVAYYNDILAALDLAFEGLATMAPRKHRLLNFLNKQV